MWPNIVFSLLILDSLNQKMYYEISLTAYAYPILPLEFSYRIEFLNITYRPWRLLAFVMALPCAVTACLLQFFYESPKFLASNGRCEEALHILKNIYVCNTGCSAETFPVSKNCVYFCILFFIHLHYYIPV